MNILAKIVRILGWAWIAIAGLVIVAVSAIILFKEGFGALQDTLNPYNIGSIIAVALRLAPGLVLLQLADAIQRRLRRKIVAALIAFPVTVGIVILMFSIAIHNGGKDEQWADAIHAKDRSWRADACSDYWVTSACSEVKGFDDPGELPSVIRVGDVITLRDKKGKESTFTVQNIRVFTYSKDLDKVYGGERYTAKKGDTTCTLYDERSRSKITRKEGSWLSRVVVKNCQEAVLPGKTTYETTVGVFPKEFLQFSTVQQEAYVRGVLDGEYILLEINKSPDRDGFVSCLNAQLAAILSQAISFVEREGEQKYLMPWTLSRLVGKTCPKETRIPPKNSPEYAEAATHLKLISKKPSDPVYSEEEQDAIDKAFIRGVLDGKVFGLYGHSYPKLVDYLECISKPGSLDNIFRIMRISQNLGQDLDKSQAFNVLQGEASVCKEFNE